MKNSKKIVLMSVVIILLAGGIFVYSDGRKEHKVVALDNQKSEIDSELTIKSTDNIKFFSGVYWLDSGKILGVKDQPLDEKDSSKAKLCIYNVKDKNFQEMVTANEKEWIGVGALSEDEKYVFYSILLNGNFKANLYDYYVLDLNSKTTTNLVENMTTSSNLVNNQVFVAAGMKVYKCDVDGNVEEISLPKELIDELQDFSSFTFKDYSDAYYKGETIEGEMLKLIESNYNYRKQHNAIRKIFQSKNKLFLRSNNATLFAYDMDKKSYRVATDEERKEVYPIPSKLNDRIKKEFHEDGKIVLWKVDEHGKKVDIIEEGYDFYGKESLDNSKIAYSIYKVGGQYGSYVYDLNKDKKIKIFAEIIGRVEWNKTSKEFFVSSYKADESKERYNVTSVVRLTD